MADWRTILDPIGMIKAHLWEDAKGKLRGMVAVHGQTNASIPRPAGPSYNDIAEAVEGFIKNFEDNGYHE